MKQESVKHRILILGASGFIGNAIYKELCGYFRTFGTYTTPIKNFEKNQHFFHYNVKKMMLLKFLKLLNQL